MNHLVHKAVVLLLLLGAVGESVAQADLFTQLKFHRLDESQGFTNNVVSDILQDSLGQVWVATNEGLFRYQGFGFQRFVRDRRDTGSLHNNFVDDLYLDSGNDVWIMTDDGVSRYDYGVDRIERYRPQEIFGRISSMAMDEDGNRYFGRYEGGIVMVTHDSVRRLPLYDPVSGIDFGAHSVTDLAILDGELWATVGDLGVIHYTLSSGTLRVFTSPMIAGQSKLQLFELYIDPRGKVWIGSERGVYGLAMSEAGVQTVDRSLEGLLPVDDYLTLFRDGEDKLWVGSRQHGMFLLTASDGQRYDGVQAFTPSSDVYGISHRTVSRIYGERNGYIWVGTHNGGINVFNPAGETVRTLTSLPGNSPYSLRYQSVWGLAESEDGTIWVGTDGKGLSLLDPTTGELRNNVIEELGEQAVLALREDSRGRLWIGTYDDGAYLYERGTGSLTHFRVGSENSGLEVNDVRCFYEDKAGTIYAGTNRGGLYRYAEESGRLERVEEVPPFDIRAIESYNDEVLWLGTFGDGLKKFNVVQGKIVDSPWSMDGVHGKDVIYDIDKQGSTLWIGTRHHGVVVFDIATEQFRDVPALAELEGRLISGLQLDGAENLWVNTNEGILFFDRQANELKQFGVEDGFQSGHFNLGSIFYSSRGDYMAVGGIHGLNLFRPDELVAEPAGSSIVLNEFKIYDTIVNPVNSAVFPEGKSIFLTDRVDLDYTDNIFSLQYSLPGFSNYKKRDFAYKLEGYDADWQSSSESTVATYRNVPPGEYTFRVKSLKNGSEKQLAVAIHPPLWKTWPAYTAYLALLLLLLWRLNRFSNSRLALRQKLEFEQELREKEHAVMQEKLRFYTNFSHELKTPLTLIQGPVNDLIHTVEDRQQLQYLELIRKNTGIILKFIGRMLEFRKIELNKTVLKVGRYDLSILAREEAERFRYLAREREINFGFYCESELEAWVDREQIQIVIDNLLSNAFKFTPAGKAVNFGIREQGEDLLIEVSDEGVGIRADELSNIFLPFFQASNSSSAGGTGIGLSLSKSFVELHGGTIDVESREDKGTRFTICLPRDRAHFAELDYVRFIEAPLPAAAGPVELSVAAEAGEMLEETGNERVLLVVDDNADICAYVSSLFTGEYRVLTAENGQAAYALSLEHVPDIIISDMMMPGMNGFEFCEKIKTTLSTSHIPVIMLTAKDTKEDKIGGYEVGADDYITKPFASEVLIARVSNLLRNRARLELRYESNDLIDPQSEEDSREIEFVLRAEATILELLDKGEFTVPVLCRELGMSQSVLYRKVKSLTGVSIQVFIKKVRLKRAAQLILLTDRTIGEIAYSLNFSDPKYFRKCFREQFGVNPSEYKSTHGQPDVQEDSPVNVR